MNDERQETVDDICQRRRGVIVYECDMCGKQTQQGMQIIKIATPPNSYESYLITRPFMLCHDCAVQLVEFIKQVKKANDHEKEGGKS